MDWLRDLTSSYGALSSANQIELLAVISQTIAALLSLAALILSLWVYSRQQRLNRWQLRLHREDHIISWSQSCITLMAEVEEHLRAQGQHELTPLPHDDFIRIRSRLSALIDEGRLYFPNLRGTRHGIEKPEAYKGHRQPILDQLVFAYDFLAEIQSAASRTPVEPVIEKFNQFRRAFVSDAQSAIDPRTFNRIRA